MPKTASTTCAFYFLDSGLISDNDRYSNKTARRIKQLVRESDLEISNRCVEDIGFTKYSHAKHKDILIDYPETKDYISIATVRNPTERIISAAVMLCEENVTAQVLNSNIDFILNKKHILSVPQYEFVSDDTILWPIEHVKEKIEEFILDRGGSFRGNWHCRKTNSSQYKTLLSKELISKIELEYGEDFELWERAMAQSY